MTTNKMMLIAAMLTLATAARAEEPSMFSKAESYRAADCARIERNFTAALASTNPGVVESAVSHMAMAKLHAPDWCLKRIEKKLEELSLNGSTPAIRYKAYLATMIFANPALFTAERNRNYATSDELFKAVSERLSGSLLTANEE